MSYNCKLSTQNIKLDLTSRKGRHCVTHTEGVKRDTLCSILIAFSKINSEFPYSRSSSGRVDRVMDSHTTGPGLRLGGYSTISTERLTDYLLNYECVSGFFQNAFLSTLFKII